MRTLLFVCLPFVTAALSQDQPPPPKPLTTPYYPLKVGNTWTYQSGKGQVVIRVEREVLLDTHRKTKEGKAELVAGYQLRLTAGPNASSEQVVVLPKGVYRYSAAGKPAPTPWRLLALPVPAEGKKATWHIDQKSADDKTMLGDFEQSTETIELTLGDRTLELPTVKVHSKNLRIDDQPVSITYWFAENFGLVKQTQQTGSAPAATLELRKFEAGK